MMKALDPASPLPASLYEPVSAASPTGAALERYEFVNFDAARIGTPANDSVKGKEIKGTPPDFKHARFMAMELLEKTRDLRLLAGLVEVEANINGARGLHAAVHLLSHYVEEYWDELHPLVETEGEGMRRRALMPLVDSKPTVLGLENAEIFRGLGLDGAFSMLTFLQAAGARHVPEEQIGWSRDAVADAIKRGGADGRVAESHDALSASLELCTQLEIVLAKKFERPLKLEKLRKALSSQAEVLASFAAADRPAAEDPEVDAHANPPSPVHGDANVVMTAKQAKDLTDAVLRYYARNARSSPVPLVLLRIKSLSTSTFAEWRMAAAPKGEDGAALEIGDVDPAQLADYAADDAGEFGAAFAERFNRLRRIVVESGADGAEEALTTLDEMAKDLANLRPISLKGRPVVSDRAEVSQALESLAIYYESNEPSSPAAPLLRRAKKLVNSSFIDTIRELAPDGGDSVALTLKPREKNA